MKRIAITGGAGEGKSTVLGYLQELGYSVESSDLIARQVFERLDVQQSLADILNTEGPIEPAVLRASLSSPVTRREVNALMHPLILTSLKSATANFFEVPLLLETCLQGHFDEVWVVTCGPDEQLRRLSIRLQSDSAAKALICTQLTSRVKIAFADRIIRTNQPESSVKRCVTLAVQRDLR